MNQRYQSLALERVRALLETHATKIQGQTIDAAQVFTEDTLVAAASAMSLPPALKILSGAFHLSRFEQDVLLLCAGVEMDARFAQLCSLCQCDPARAYPTWGLALAALPDPHWNALVPTSPLRRWKLVEMQHSNSLTSAPLRIDERILHYLAGLQYLDERLAGFLEPVPSPGPLIPSHRSLVDKIANIFSHTYPTPKPRGIQLCGDDNSGKRAVAYELCNRFGIPLYTIPGATLPQNPSDLDILVLLCEREAVLTGCIILVDCDEVDLDALGSLTLRRFVDRSETALILTTRHRRRIGNRPMVNFDVDRPTTAEQRDLWRNTVGGRNGYVNSLVSQFSFSASDIYDVGSSVGDLIHGREEEYSPEEISRILSEACKQKARARLSELAQRIESSFLWDDLVLSEQQIYVLRSIAVQVRCRLKVYEDWGFREKCSRGLGISAAFAGPSGTGKTMAAEVLARELGLDLYRIDLSAVVSKYVGETEKNLRRIFDAAEEGGAILLFDEADALFGKRSEVKDSHDRYANIEISYLLQRMEQYRGLAVLTTNLKNALDTAFLRRIRFLVQFPFPGAAQRAEIWRRIFPRATPSEGLDCLKLAQLNITGGHIRNIALTAAFLAANSNECVRMHHVLDASKLEYAKMERSLTAVEISGWL